MSYPPTTITYSKCIQTSFKRSFKLHFNLIYLKLIQTSFIIRNLFKTASNFSVDVVVTFSVSLPTLLGTRTNQFYSDRVNPML